MQTAQLRNKKGISPVWSLPLLAVAICGWILFRSIQNAGIPIEVYFNDASGLVAGKTQVVVRGIPVGTVTKISPDLANRRIKASISMDKSVEDQLVEDTQFWVVRPEISAASVQGLDTLLQGSYISFQPGEAKEESRTFTGLDSAPPVPESTPGLHLVLHAKELGSLQPGSEISYHNIPVGSVTHTELNEADNTPVIKIFIEKKYMNLVREGSRFYNASGLSVSGKVTNLKIHVASLASLLKGGIVLYTPEEFQKTPPAASGQIFELFEDMDAVRYGVSMTLQLSSSEGITEGATQVIYRGMVAGIVKTIRMNQSGTQNGKAIAQIMLDPRAEGALRSGTRFWVVRPEISLQKVAHLDAIFTGPYITFEPGEGEFQDQFVSLPEAPAQRPLRPGKEITLTSKSSCGLTTGTAITYQKKRVGEIVSVDLDPALANFEIRIYLYEPYDKLVKAHSVFWNESGISLNASLAGITLNTGTLTNIIGGGIAFTSPDAGIDGPGGTTYPLHPSYAEAVTASPLLQKQGLHFTLVSDGEESISEGTGIFYKNIKVGEVKGLSLNGDNTKRLLTCFIDEKYRSTVNASTRFYDISGFEITGGVDGIDLKTTTLQDLVSGGISYYTPDKNARRAQNSFPLYKNREKSENPDKFPVTVRFASTDTLQEETPVKYRGILIGKVASLKFSKNLDEIEAHLLINKEAIPFFRNDTRIWLENAQISLDGVKNLQSILFGPYIAIKPGTGKQCQTFTALASTPPSTAERGDGLHVVLTSKHLGSLKPDSPIYYRQIRVGKVISYELSENYQHVLIDIEIEKRYAPIIRENTCFWKVSGTRIEGGIFSGVTVSTESVEALLTGGIALATPDNEEMGGPVSDGHYFPLHEKVEKGWLDWQPNVTIVEKETGTVPERK